MSNSTENSTSPLCNFLALRKQGWFDNLQKEETHIVLFAHLMHNEIYSSEPSLHQLLYVSKLTLDAFDQDMRKVLVVIFQKGDCLLSTDVDAAHQLFYYIL